MPGLNETLANEVIASVDALCRTERPRVAARSPKALLVLSPRAGFGKSHLVGALFRALSSQATLVNIPLDFIARLAALVPKPRVNLTRCHGVFAP